MPWLLLVLALCSSAATAAELPAMPIEQFERDADGSGWPGWGAPFGPDRDHLRLDRVADRWGHAGRLIYQSARYHVMLPVPEVRLLGRPLTLTAQLYGDASGTIVSTNLIDATDEWFTTPGLTIDWTGWRRIKLDLTRPSAHHGGDDNGRLDAPAGLLSLNLTFAGRSSGELRFDDLFVEQRPFQAVDYLGLELGDAGPGGIYLPEVRSHTIRIYNRSASSIPVTVAWQVAGQQGTQDILPSARGSLEVPIRLEQPGPQELRVRLQTPDGQRESALPIALLPKRLGTVDGFLGGGHYTLADVGSGRLLNQLPVLRVAELGWTVLDLTGLADPAPSEVENLLSLAWGQGLQVVVRLGDAASRVLGEGPRWTEDQTTWWVPAPPPLPGETPDQTAAEHDRWLTWLRAAAHRQMLLVDWRSFGPDYLTRVTQPYDAVMTALTHSRLPLLSGAPFASRALLAAPLAPGVPNWLWLDEPDWEALTGMADAPAAAVVTATCARAVPNLSRFGFGRLPGRLTEASHPPLPPTDPTILALAVNGRLLGGAECQGLTALGPGVYGVEFTNAGRRLEVLWSEGEETPWTPDTNQECSDLYGRRLPRGELKLTAEPVYAVSPSG